MANRGSWLGAKILRAPKTIQMLSRIKWAQLRARGFKGYLEFRKKCLHNLLARKYPHAVQIEPFGGCNIRCSMCFQGRMLLPAGQEELPLEGYRRIIDELSPVVPYIYLYWRGEPMMHKQLGEMISYAKQRGMYVFTSTNAVLLDESRAIEFIEAGLDFLLVGFDGASKETYELMRRGARFDQVVRNITRLLELRQRYQARLPHVCLQFIVSSVNQCELVSFRRLAEKMGVDSCIEKILDVYQNFENEKLRTALAPLYVSGVWSKYEARGQQFQIIRRPLVCEMASRMIIRADLELALCCYDMQGEFAIGNARAGRLLDLWQRPDYSELREMGRRRKTRLCTNCGEGIQR